MSAKFKGGNSRLLVKVLDATQDPLAILDRRGQIIFVNAAFCEAADSDATVLVGKQCRWELASDDEPLGALLNALAPPAGARKGRLVVRDLPLSPFDINSARHSLTSNERTRGESPALAQVFVPILDEDGLVNLTIVLWASSVQLRSQFGCDRPTAGPFDQQSIEQTLVDIRSRWKNLDDLQPLLGLSPAIRLATKRAHMAVGTPCNVFLSGPRYIGKQQVARGIFKARLTASGMTSAAGQFFSVDLGLRDEASLDGMLDVFAGRLRSEESTMLHLLVLQRADRCSENSINRLLRFIDIHHANCTLVALSEITSQQLAERDANWQDLVGSIAEIEIALPPLCERREDIPILAQQFLAAYCRQTERALLEFSPDAMQLLLGYNWPRNLRELQSAVNHSVDQAELTRVLDVNHLPVEIRTFPSSVHNAGSVAAEPINLDLLLEEVERTVISRALRLSPRNRAQVARWLGISRARLLRRISQLGLDTNERQDG